VKPLANLALYRLGLLSGHYRRVSKNLSTIPDVSQITPSWPMTIPDAEELRRILKDSVSAQLHRADDILEGKYPIFGGDLSPIDLTPPLPLSNWTDYELGKVGQELGDIKYSWEPARFCWAVNLAQAYYLTGKEVYAEKFWLLLEEFCQSNPLYQGPNWVSAQECAVRILTTSYALNIFFQRSSVSAARQKTALEFLIFNARRIPLTLPYSRAQNNNHLLLEGTGLLTAGSILKGYPESPRWKSLGWEIIKSALGCQIAPGGEYCQHSINYHRFMLQASVWINLVLKTNGEEFPPEILSKLQRAVEWYAGLIDTDSGRVPNLGSNDGAWLFPLGSVDFADHRPTAQAACIAFFGRRLYEKHDHDELAEWMANPNNKTKGNSPNLPCNDSYIRMGVDGDWAVMRASKMKNRPFQADQLHVDLWEGGQNILLDAGTYSYNAPPPWNNALARTLVHNTATVDGRDQMTRAGRFLWLDWAQAEITGTNSSSGEAFHDGYRQIGARHTRNLQRIGSGEWQVKDTFTGVQNEMNHEIILQWLLPDGNFSFAGDTLVVKLASTTVKIETLEKMADDFYPGEIQLIRAGVLMYGTGDAPPVCGWYSPTYGQKIPALSFRVKFRSSLPLIVQTQIKLDPHAARERGG
jgi:hypothetical protein